MPKTIIITAGGKGLRMGSDIPKQFIELKGKPILFYTIEKFHEFDSSIEIILVLPFNHIEYWQSLIEKFQFKIPHLIVAGGETRYHSIKNGLSKANGNIIGVHDGVRPLVSIDVISHVYNAAEENGAAIPVLPLIESIREVSTNNSSIAKDRSLYRSVQTPQCFKRNVLLEAYEKPFQNTFTDDASVVEANGSEIVLVDGNSENIKITSPIDLKIAEFLLD